MMRSRSLLGVLLATAAVAVFVLRASRSDVDLCRAVLAGLTQGRSSVAGQIAWERLRALDLDVGATYVKLPNAKEQGEYRQAFIENFAAGFQRTGASLPQFTGWRVQERSKGTIIVAADYAARQKTLLLTLPANASWWGKKIEAIQWQ